MSLIFLILCLDQRHATQPVTVYYHSPPACGNSFYGLLLVNQTQVNTSFTGNFLYLVLQRGRFQPQSCFAYSGFLALVSELLVCCIAKITHNEMILLLKSTFCTKYKSI